MKIIKIITILFLLSSAIGCGLQQNLLSAQASEEIIGIVVNGEELSLEIANTPQAWAQGLSSRELLPRQHGMLFVFPDYRQRYFWMKEMYLSLDMIWIKDNQIKGCTPDVPPPIYYQPLDQLPLYNSPSAVDKVLEVRSGFCFDNQVKPGEYVSFIKKQF